MATSALSYAEQLRRNDRKGPVGTHQHFDTTSEVARKFKMLIEFMTSSKCTIAHTGAGVSTGSGIPDFRGPSGVWTVMKRQTNKRRKVTDGDCTVRGVSSDVVTYGKYRRKVVDFNLALPSEAHLAILELVRCGKIAFVVTQNIDGLHATSGLEFDKVSELHGNVFTERCTFCSRRFLRTFVSPTISFKPTGNLCGICTFPPSGLLTDVVLDWFDAYERHFERSAIENSESGDFHLALGSSLHVEPACHYLSVDYHRKQEAPLVIVNFQKTKLDQEADEVIHYDVNKICLRLLKEFKIPKPKYIKRVHLIIVLCQIDGRCIAYIRFPCIEAINVPAEYVSQGTSTECLHSVHGIYKFTYSAPFKANLTLWFQAKMTITFPSTSTQLPRAYCWKVALAATTGSSVPKTDAKTFTIAPPPSAKIPHIESIELKHNVHLIEATKVVEFVGLLDVDAPDGFSFVQVPLPPSLNVLAKDWSLVASVDFIQSTILDVKKEDATVNGCTADLSPVVIVPIKCEDDQPADENVKLPKSTTNGHEGYLEKLMNFNPCLGHMIKVAIENKVCTIQNEQVIPDASVLDVSNFVKACKNNQSLSFWVGESVKLGHLLHKVPQNVKGSTSRRYTCVTNTLERGNGNGRCNALQVMFYTILRQCIDEALNASATSVYIYKLIDDFRRLYPRWVLHFIGDVFECR